MKKYGVLKVSQEIMKRKWKVPHSTARREGGGGER
jgi:hypothetical protein